MSKIDVNMVILPDIEMYGGDNEPWQVQMMHDDGTCYLISEVVGYTAVLTIMPFIYSAGLGLNGAAPILTKNGTFGQYDHNKAMAVFSFTTTDTLSFSGKYTYQIEFIYGSGKRIGQGNLYIRNNINR